MAVIFKLIMGHQSGNMLKRGAYSLSKTSAMPIRGYAVAAPPPRPATNTTVAKSDADLWKAYNKGLRDFIFTGKKLDTKTQAFFTAPMGVLGIPAGANVAQPITNMGIYQIGDCLLDANSPVFTPGAGGSYIDRQSRYLNAIQLKKNTNAGAWVRLQTAQKKQEQIQTKMDDLRTKATTAFGADAGKPPTMSFKTWVTRNYPQYDSVNSELQQAASATGAAMIEVYGPGAKDLQRKINMVDKALDMDEAAPGNNMQVSEVQPDVINGGQLDANAPPEYRPLYTIQGGYNDQVKQWMANSAADSASARKTTIDINTSKSSSESWEESGFSKTSVGVIGSYWFITVRSNVNNVETEEHISAEQLGSGLSVKLTAASIKAFDIKPGAWDGDFTKLFSSKDVSLLANFSLPPACAVTQVIMGYNVSLDISLSAAAAKQVSDFVSKHSSEGASVSIFGIPVNIGASGSHEQAKSTSYSIQNNQNSFSSFSVAGEDSGYPVVLAVVGKKLPAIGTAAH